MYVVHTHTDLHLYRNYVLNTANLIQLVSTLAKLDTKTNLEIPETKELQENIKCANFGEPSRPEARGQAGNWGTLSRSIKEGIESEKKDDAGGWKKKSRRET